MVKQVIRGVIMPRGKREQNPKPNLQMMHFYSLQQRMTM
jgi:hypothetical protein